jgi:peptidylprolyl isomerase/peptidyl-prolyl cis-trans isomerase B (cyclophilin B)
LGCSTRFAGTRDHARTRGESTVEWAAHVIEEDQMRRWLRFGLLLIATVRPGLLAEAQEKRMPPMAVIEMAKGGEIRVELFPEDAPKTVESFVALAKKGFYDGLAFHRVIPGFVAQGGDPKGDGTGGPGYTLKAEFNARKHVRGTLAMARAQHPDSAGSQFFICFTPQPHLDGKYTVFGQVVMGMEVVDRIKVGDRMKTIRIEAPAKP